MSAPVEWTSSQLHAEMERELDLIARSGAEVFRVPGFMWRFSTLSIISYRLDVGKRTEIAPSWLARLSCWLRGQPKPEPTISYGDSILHIWCADKQTYGLKFTEEDHARIALAFIDAVAGRTRDAFEELRHDFETPPMMKETGK